MHFEFANFYYVLIRLELKHSIHVAPVLENQPDSTPKWAKCFQTKKTQTPYPSIIEGSTNPDPFHDC